MMARCPHLRTIEAWARQGSEAPLSAEHAAHAKECDSCRQFIDEVQGARELASSLPIHEVTTQRHEAIRFELMAAARRWKQEQGTGEQKRRSGRRSLAVLAAAACVAAVVLGAALVASLSRDDRGEEPAPIAQVRLMEGAAGETVNAGPDEIYRLIRGTGEFEVRPLSRGERFRVFAGDGVVEVRGTIFRVEVLEGRLKAVNVREGHVLVDVGDRRVASLEAGGRWARAQETEVASAETSSGDIAPELPHVDTPVVESSEEAAPSPTPSLVRSERPTTPARAPGAARREPVARRTALVPPPVTERAQVVPEVQPRVSPTDDESEQPSPAEVDGPQEGEPGAASSGASEVATEAPANDPEQTSRDEAFARAWQMLRIGRPREAARAFDVLWAREGLDPARRADVLYWSAEAYRRAGDMGMAESRAAMLLGESPSAWRAPEASLIVGESALRRGDVDAARRALEHAANAGRPGISDRARHALERLDEGTPTEPH